MGVWEWEMIGAGSVDWKEGRARRAQQEAGQQGRVMGSRVMCTSRGGERGARREECQALPCSLLGSGSVATSGATAPRIAPG